MTHAAHAMEFSSKRATRLIQHSHPRVLEPRTGWQGLRSPAPPKGAMQCPQPTQSRHMRRRRVKRRVLSTARAAPDRGYRVLSGGRATHASFFFFFITVIPLCVRFSVSRNGQGKNARSMASVQKFPIKPSKEFRPANHAHAKTYFFLYSLHHA